MGNVICVKDKPTLSGCWMSKVRDEFLKGLQFTGKSIPIPHFDPFLHPRCKNGYWAYLNCVYLAASSYNN